MGGFHCGGENQSLTNGGSMTTHLAYPNVIPRERRFIGCGRYGVFLPGDTPKSYQPLDETPNTPNRMVLDHAMQILGPEGYASLETIHEKKDRPDQRYQGDSLDLAYLLAHILRGRKFRSAFPGDLWCTGAVQISEGQPILRKVDSTGFDLKLEAFLSKENRDSIFIVPAANVNTRIQSNLDDQEVKVLNVGQIVPKRLDKAITGYNKIMIKVLPHELPSLIETLFISRNPKYGFVKWILTLLVLIAAAGLVWINKKPPPLDIGPDSVKTSLIKGDFQEALTLLAQAGDDQSWAREILKTLNTPLNAKAHLIYRKDGTTQHHQMNMASAELAELTLTHHDYYRIEVQTKNTVQPLYLYLFQLDSQGNLDRLFPSRLWGTRNPVTADRLPVKIPSGKSEWLYLSKPEYGIKGLIKEQLLLLLTPWPAEDMEVLFEKIQSTQDGGQRRMLLGKFLGRLQQRVETLIQSTFVLQASFWHGS
jgi:hypothetical protein